MIKIWAKVVKKGKIIKQFVLEKQKNIDYADFFEYLREICENLDIPTPVLIKQHLFNYAKYNNVKIKKSNKKPNECADYNQCKCNNRCYFHILSSDNIICKKQKKYSGKPEYLKIS